MKKILIFIITAWLALSLNLTARAEYKKAFMEYRKEEYLDDYGPKIGFNWGVNDRLSFFSSYEYNGNKENDTYLELQYQFIKNCSLGLMYETIDSEDSNGVYFDISRAVNNSLWVSSRFSYMANYPRGTKAGNPDYYERKFFGGLRYQLNKDWLALANCYLTETDVEQGIWQGNYDSKELELSTGLEYLINKSWRVSGSYDVTKTDYENKSWADLTVNKYIVGVIYNIDKYDFYLWYDIPEKDNTVTLGVAYTF